MLKTNRALMLCLILVCSVLALAGCRKGVPIQNQSSPMPLMEKVSDKEVAEAIIRAGAVTAWEIVPSGPGEMVGTLHIRSHMAQVAIKYTNKNYQITYKSSSNLNYKDGEIHPNYNKWVMTLDNNIRRELASLSKK